MTSDESEAASTPTHRNTSIAPVGSVAPRASRRPHKLEMHGDFRTDDWYWLADKDNPEVTDLLHQENAHTEAVLAHTKALQDEIYQEFLSRIQQTDLSVPVRWEDWWYYSRTVEGENYAIRCRRPINRTTPHDYDETTPEQILLNPNELAGSSDYFSLGAFDISADANWLAYAIDLEGDEIYSVHFKDLRTDEHLDDVLEESFGDLAWSYHADYLFYIKADGPMRPYQVWRHCIGTNQSEDVLVFHEQDDRYFVGISTSLDDRMILVYSASKTSTEMRYLRADEPLSPFTVLQPREDDHEYYASYWRSRDGEERFYLTTNWKALNWRVMSCSLDDTQKESWTEVVPHDLEVRIEDVTAFHDFLLISDRRNANSGFSMVDLATGQLTVPTHPEDVFAVDTYSSLPFDSTYVRYTYTSPTTPVTIYDLDVLNNTTTLRKQQQVLGPFDASHYRAWREWAVAEDGTRIPLTLVARRNRSNPGPTLLYGYGAYEISVEPAFSPLRISLLDRGVLFVIAHVRGGGENGRMWYDNGKQANKINTFTDFISSARHLVDQHYTTPSQLAIRGGSAGGLLMGAVANLAPELFGAIIAEVPFVDTLTTMTDPTIPLTTHEYDEWGDPNEPDVYARIKSYSPVDNVRAVDYPPMFVTAGLNDPLVRYVEPAKWVQKLRATKTDTNDILLKTEMGAGHQGLSGRYDAWNDEAQVYAYLLTTLQQP